MALYGQSPHQVRFGEFQLDLESGELQSNGHRLILQDQPFQVLTILLQHPGRLVSREELKKKLWPTDTFVDFDHGLNKAVNRLRETLSDSADHPRFIETLPRKGYRFIGSVDNVAPAVASGNAPKVNWTTRWISVGATLALLCGVGIWRFSRSSSEVPLPAIEMVPLAGLSGFETQPAFAPDGIHVAFVLHASENSGIYTVMAGGEKSLRLTSNSTDCCPTWSPDGRHVLFSRLSDRGVEIYVVPALGGTERRLPAWPSGHHVSTKAPNWVNARILDWSPDGKFVAFSDNQEDKTHAWIALLSIDDSTIRPLTFPQAQVVDEGPAFSPDGSTIAFVRGIASGVVQDLYVVPVAGGSPRRLTFDNTWIYGAPAWTRDGRDIVFSSARGGLASLWRVSALGGTPKPIPGVGVIAAFPSVSPRGNQLVYQQMDAKVDIWRLNLKDERHPQGPPGAFISEKGGHSRPHFSSDGKRIVFDSDRLGYAEIWACDSDGSNCGQLTSLHGETGAARWSPDSRYIAFEYRPKEHSEVYLLELASGVPRLLTTLPGADNGGPSWSRDGKWIYFYSDHGGGPFQLWKIQVEGGTPVQVTNNGGIFGAESADGRFLYYSKYQTPGIWRMPLNGGDEVHILDQPGGESWWNWCVGSSGIYFFGSNGRNKWGVNFFDFATRQKVLLATADRPSVGLAVAPDGKSLLYVQNDQMGGQFGRYEWANSRIMLAKNFR